MIDRNLILKGPAVVIRDGHTYFTREQITLRAVKDTWTVASNISGSAGERISGKTILVTFTPQGLLDDADAYFPWLALADLGSQIFGAADTPLVIHTLSGRTLTLPASANLGVRRLHLGTDATALGEISFLCLGKLSTDDTDPAARHTVAEAAYASGLYDRTKIRTPGYQAALTVGTGETAVTTEMEGLEGFDIDIAPDFDPDSVNAYGPVGQTFTGLAVSALFKPCNLTEAEVLALLRLQGTGAQEIGDDLAITDAVLTVSPANALAKGVTAVLYGVGAKEAEFQFGLKAKRVQGLAMTASPVAVGSAYKLIDITFPSWS